MLYGNENRILDIYNSNDALNFYKFILDFSDVEWSIINIKNSIGEIETYLGTCHSENTDATTDFLFNKVPMTDFISYRHLHPGGSRTVSPGDKNLAEDIQNKYPNARLFIDIPFDFYNPYEYDKNSEVGLLPEIVIFGGN